MDATPATAAAADIISPKTAMLADGVVTQGTGSGGGGGLEYETGTWTPASDIARGEISFAKTHTTPPFFVLVQDATGTYFGTTYSNFAEVYVDYERFTGAGLATGASDITHYGLAANQYRATSVTAISASSPVAITTPSSSLIANSSQCARYWANESKFFPYTNGNSRYWRAGRTYKWIAVWAPTA